MPKSSKSLQLNREDFLNALFSQDRNSIYVAGFEPGQKALSPSPLQERDFPTDSEHEKLSSMRAGKESETSTDPDFEELFPLSPEEDAREQEKVITGFVKCSGYFYDTAKRILIIIHPPTLTGGASPEDVLKNIQLVEDAILKGLSLENQTITVKSIIPDIAAGRLKKASRGRFGGDHIRLGIEEHTTNKPKERKKTIIDPRDVAQGTFDDTNCGRYVLGMTVVAAQLLQEGTEVTAKKLKQSPFIKRIAAAESVGDLQKTLLTRKLAISQRNAPGRTSEAIKIELQSMLEIYAIRSVNAKQYLSPFGRLFGHSATSKNQATQDVLKQINKKSEAPVEIKNLPSAAKSGLLGKLIKQYNAALRREQEETSTDSERTPLRKKR